MNGIKERNFYIPDELMDRLNLHNHWVETSGREGKRLIANNEFYTDLEIDSFNLSGAIFEKCILNCVNFGDLKNAEFHDCYFHYGELIFSCCNGAKFINCKFYDVCFEEADLTGCIFENCIFKDCDLCGAVIKDAVLKDTCFDNSGYTAEIFNTKVENLVIKNLGENVRITIKSE